MYILPFNDVCETSATKEYELFSCDSMPTMRHFWQTASEKSIQALAYMLVSCIQSSFQPKIKIRTKLRPTQRTAHKLKEQHTINWTEKCSHTVNLSVPPLKKNTHNRTENEWSLKIVWCDRKNWNDHIETWGLVYMFQKFKKRKFKREEKTLFALKCALLFLCVL